jgi:glutamyl-tRNA synthetase
MPETFVVLPVQERMEGIDSARRGRSAEESLAVWKEMVAGSPEGQRHCMRFKINMQEPNKALRDPVAYRCNATTHWRTGTKYKACPPPSLALPAALECWELGKHLLCHA